ncbi:PKD domain-containing protein [Streptomyces sp. BE20]|uniref:PKD domain-containing protein n=1 Tax=Streptomyces sp. BE20 TaxID=3002525 RepID=UPI002E797549|nr:PKD domain-containing protein [Streptomyces sp. BE20]MEE1825810.1 PKD domain-containing protein [Streptomyces sp. BE20]
MRLRHVLGLTVATASAALGLPGPATAAPAATATTLHVNELSRDCADQGAGTGTVARPFCTVSAAAAVVEPGQTVRVWPGDYPEEVRITRSGTPEQPITFLGGPVDTAPFRNAPAVRGPADRSSFVLTGVHDVTIRGFRTFAPRGVQVLGSTRVVIDQNWYDRSGYQQSLHIGEGSDHVTVSRNSFNHGYGLVVDGAAHHVLVTGNDFSRTSTTGVTATGVADLAVTNNTFALTCFGSVLLDGDSPRAVVKNNIAVDGNAKSGQADRPYCSPFGDDQAQITVSAAAAPTASVDYNVVHAKSGSQPYKWAGTRYASPAAFAAATGQGTHDLDLDIEYSAMTPDRPFNRLTPAAVGAIDSADPTAPGVGTDLFGQPALDHPDVANTGTGTRDRGAHELGGMVGETRLEITGEGVTTPKGPVPFTVVARLGFDNSWNLGPGAYLVDFGDGSEPVRTTDATVRHTYTSTGFHLVTATAVDAAGGRAAAAISTIQANPDFPLLASFNAKNAGWPYTYEFELSGMSPYALVDGTIDFGDGNTAVVHSDTDRVTHSYAAAGTYTVTFTARDEARQQAVSRELQVTETPSLAVLKPGERVQVLATGYSSLLNSGAHYGYGVWAPFTSVPADGRPFPENAVTSTAVGTTDDGVVHNVVAAAGRIHITDRSMADGSWSRWGEVTAGYAAGPLPAAPQQVAVTAMGRKLHVLALVGGRVYQATGDWNSGTWSGWGDVTSASGLHGAARITAARNGNSLHVVALGTDGRVYDAEGNYDRGAWSSGDVTSALGLPSGGPVTQLSAASIGSTLHVVATAGGRLHQASGDYAAGRWSGWGDVTAATGDRGSVDRVSAVAIGNRLHLYTVVGGLLYNATGDYDRGAWSEWASVSAAVGAPTLGELAVTAS